MKILKIVKTVSYAYAKLPVPCIKVVVIQKQFNISW